MGFSEFTDEVWAQLCLHAYKLRLAFGISVVVILLLFVALSVAETGSATYVVIVVDLVSLGVVAAVMGFVVWKCEHAE